jgi:Flp pilus assembly protein TadG
MSLLDRDERGAVAVELVVIVPALIIMLGLLIAGGRIWFAKSAVAQAAQAASRAASLERTAGAARVAGRDAARSSLATGGLNCADRSTSIDSSGFAVAVGVPATVRATVTCRITFADVLLPGIPGSMTVTRTEGSALDTYRTRS